MKASTFVSLINSSYFPSSPANSLNCVAVVADLKLSASSSALLAPENSEILPKASKDSANLETNAPVLSNPSAPLVNIFRNPPSP